MIRSRYPYTYACDFIRSLAGYNKTGTKISRADASIIRSTIAKILGIDDKYLAEKLADEQLKKTGEHFNKELNQWLQLQGEKNE